MTTREILERERFAAAAADMTSMAGVALHLRGGTMPGRRLIALASALEPVPGAAVLVNDRIDVALAVEAEGVHLPERGMPPGAARTLIGKRRLLGRSLHDARDVPTPDDPDLDYVFLGPIWPTTSHPGRPPLGPNGLRGDQVPVVAVGGVTRTTLPHALEKGAHGVAVVGAVWGAADPAAEAHEILLLLERYSS